VPDKEERMNMEGSSKFKVQNAKCKLREVRSQNAECKVQNADCRMTDPIEPLNPGILDSSNPFFGRRA
jgi:hypothetical protein